MHLITSMKTYNANNKKITNKKGHESDVLHVCNRNKNTKAPNKEGITQQRTRIILLELIIMRYQEHCRNDVA